LQFQFGRIDKLTQGKIFRRHLVYTQLLHLIDIERDKDLMSCSG
jgi:hypothetical protein